MAKPKKLIVTCTGKRYDYYEKKFVRITKTTEAEVSGTGLSIRKAESKAVGDFMKENNLGVAGVSSELLM